jgi:alpha-glucoside transport system substrate-binding protein
MKRQQNRGWRAWLALVLSLTLVAAAGACAGDDDEEGGGDGEEEAALDIICEESGEEPMEETTAPGQAPATTAPATTVAPDPALEGETVTVFGPEVEQEEQSLQDAFEPFEEATGITVDVSGDRGFEEQISTQVGGENAPDIAMFPQPGRISEFADDIAPLTPEVVATVGQNFDSGWTDFATSDTGEVLAIPAKADLKSVVWYCPSVWAEKGYQVPTTLEQWEALAMQMIQNGDTPLCIGLGSDAATGWPYTDWNEDYLLRMHGPDVFEQWYNHEIAFNDPRVVEAGERVYDFLSQEGMVFGGLENVASTPFADAGFPMLEGDCMMHRQGNFYQANWGEQVDSFGPGGQVDAFYLPGSAQYPSATLTGGIYATAFSDSPATMATMNYIATPEFANARVGHEVGGYLAANRNADITLYGSDLERTFGEILARGNPIGFDASDLMPGAVGSSGGEGSFWSAAVDITTGDATVADAFAEVEENWPAPGEEEEEEEE